MQSSRTRDQTRVSHIAKWILYHWAPGKPYTVIFQCIDLLLTLNTVSVGIVSVSIFCVHLIQRLLGAGVSILPMAKVMRKEARHTQRRDRASGVPLEILEHLPPSPEPACFTTLCSPLHLCLYRGLSPTTSFGEGVNLELQLIIIPGRDRSVLTYKLL